MARHSRGIDLFLDKGKRICIGDAEVITTQITGSLSGNPDKLQITEMYVSKLTGKLVIVYKDGN